MNRLAGDLVPLRCVCGSVAEERDTGRACPRCGVTSPGQGNIMDLHPGRSFAVSIVPDRLPSLVLVTRRGVDERDWLRRARERVVAGGTVCVMSPATALARRWHPTDTLGFLCRDTGELTPMQRAVALTAHRAKLLRCYPMGSWEAIDGSRMLARALGPGIALSALRARQRRRLVETVLTDRGAVEHFRSRYLPADLGTGDVLDVGCGWGHHAALLTRLGHRVVGIDIHAYPETWARIPGARFVRGDVEDVARFAPDSYDGCVCLGVLQYLADDRAALLDIARVLRPGGWLLVSAANADNPWTRRTGRRLDPRDASRRYYRATDLAAMVMAAGFRVERVGGDGLVSPVFTRAVATVTDMLLPARAARALEQAVPDARRKMVWVLAARAAA